jgi:uncharacterized protein with ParB-like and HNH nuclease domain
MRAKETKVADFFKITDTQFVIPLYQRNYNWTHEQCDRLLDDIIEVGGNDNRTAHFIGSIVYIHDDIYHSSSVKELIVIDGQQRLTTITLIYLVIHKIAKISNPKLADQIEKQVLINEFADNNDEKLKLRSADNNDKALRFLIDHDIDEKYDIEYSRLDDNFKLFRKRITEENIDIVQKGLEKLMFVDIALDRNNDDPQRIFESLNSTGLDLSEADLIRNYILMSLKKEEQDKIYRDYWEVVEKNARNESTSESRVSDYIRDYLTLIDKNVPNKNKVYKAFKIKFPHTSINDLENTLLEIKKLSKHYNKLLNPYNECDKDIARHINYINRLEVGTSFPFLMKVYDDYESSIIDKETFIDVLELI